MYPGRELNQLALLRKQRIGIIEQRRSENCASVRRLTSPLRLLDSLVLEWRSTVAPVNLAMLPIRLFLLHSEPSKLQSIQRILQSALVVLTIARRLDRIETVQTEPLDQRR